MGDGRDSDRLSDSTSKDGAFANREAGAQLGQDAYAQPDNNQLIRSGYGDFAVGNQGNQGSQGNRTYDWGGAQDPSDPGLQTPRGRGRATYGGVAPSAVDAANRPYDPSQYDRPAGRAGYGDVAVGAQQSAGNGTGANRGDGPASRPQQATRPQTNTLSSIVDQKRDIIEQSLEKHTSFWGNEVVAGTAGALAGGPLARMLSYGAKWYLVNSGTADQAKEAAVQRAESDEAKAAARKAYDQLAEERIKVGGALNDFAKELDDKAKDLAKKPAEKLTLDDKTLLEKRQFLNDILNDPQKYAESNAKKSAIPDRFFSDVELKALRRFVDIQDEIGKFKDVADERAAAAEKSLTLGQRAALWYERNHGLAPSQDFLASMRKKEANLVGDIEKQADKLKPEVEKILQEAADRALTAEEKTQLGRFLILDGKTGGQLETDLKAAGLKPEEVKLFQEKGRVQAEIQPIRDRMNAPNAFSSGDYNAMTQKLAEVEGRLGKIVEGLEPQVRQLANKPPDQWTDADKALKAKLDFLQEFNRDHTKNLGPEVRLAPGDELLGLVGERKELKNKIAQVEPIMQERQVKLPQLEQELAGIEGQIKAAADQMRPEGERLAAKLKGAADLIPSADKGKIALHNWLRGGATGEAPAEVKMTPEVAKLVADRNGALERLKAGAERLGLAGESELEATRGFKGHLKDFGKGMLYFSVVQGTESVLDRALFGKDHGNKPSWYTDSIVTPLAMMATKSPLGWGAAMVGGHLLGKYLDSKYPADPNSSYSRFMRPTGTEAFAVGAAALIPMQEETLAKRAAYVGTAWLGSKLLNYAFDSESPKSVRDDAFDLFKTDKTDRSASSMTKAIERFKDLGSEREPAVNFYLADWMGKKHDDYINGYRGAAILLTAAGETRLDRGTLVSKGMGQPTSNPVARALSFSDNSYQYDNILAGYDLDLGGRALKSLAPARVEINWAKQYTQQMLTQNPGAELRGTKVKQSEIDDLEKVGNRIDVDLAKIYGKHDIPSIYGELEQYAQKLGLSSLSPTSNNKKELEKIVDSVKATIAKTSASTDPRYRAKFCRDLVLIDLAWAGVKVGYKGVGSGGDGSSAVSLYREAQTYLAQAKQLDPNNPDNSQLEDIANDLGKLIPQQVNQQWSNPAYNPLNVNNGLYKQ